VKVRPLNLDRELEVARRKKVRELSDDFLSAEVYAR
jgi:hypothetical protein